MSKETNTLLILGVAGVAGYLLMKSGGKSEDNTGLFGGIPKIEFPAFNFPAINVSGGNSDNGIIEKLLGIVTEQKANQEKTDSIIGALLGNGKTWEGMKNPLAAFSEFVSRDKQIDVNLPTANITGGGLNIKSGGLNWQIGTRSASEWVKYIWEFPDRLAKSEDIAARTKGTMDLLFLPLDLVTSTNKNLPVYNQMIIQWQNTARAGTGGDNTVALPPAIPPQLAAYVQETQKELPAIDAPDWETRPKIKGGAR